MRYLIIFWLLYAAVLQADNKHEKTTFWEVGAGIVSVYAPHYAGSDQGDIYLFPFPYVNYDSEHFSLNREGIKSHLAETTNWDFDLSFAGTFPVDSDENRARNGMPDLDWVGLGGPAATYELGRSKTDNYQLIFPFRLAVASDFTDISYIGWESSPSIRWQRDLFDKATHWQIISQASVYYASKKYNNYVYGVDPAYANSERPAYDASQGFTGYELLIGATRRKGRFWMGSFIRYRSLADSVILDSPLTTKKDNFYVGFAAACIFGTSNR